MASLKTALCLAIVVGAAAHPVPLHGQRAPESKLKAAIVSKFPQFVDWPATALSGRTTTDICVVAPDPFGADLRDLVAGDARDGRPLTVREVNADQDATSCQILYLPVPMSAASRALLQKTAPLPVLTIGEDERFLDLGGIVRLRTVNGRVRFDVNLTAAQRAGVRISSQVLELALTVRGRT